jgi:hypothetical protein
MNLFENSFPTFTDEYDEYDEGGSSYHANPPTSTPMPTIPPSKTAAKKAVSFEESSNSNKSWIGFSMLSRTSSSTDNIPPPPSYHADEAMRGTGTVYRMFAMVFGMWFHSNVRLNEDNREGILVDTGAIDNIMSDTFYRRITDKLKGWGIRFTNPKKLPKTLTVDGVGKSAVGCKDYADIPVRLADGTEGMFQGPIIEGSEIPALWGLRSLVQQRAVVDVYNKRIFMMGPEGYRLDCSPGTKTYQLESAKSGHLLLPVTEWKENRNKHAFVALGRESVGLPMTVMSQSMNSSL